jgi:hypothetical protein
MKRYVWLEMTVLMGRPAGVDLQTKLSGMEPKMVPYGGAQRRIRATLDTEDALTAAQQALDKVKLAMADWGDVQTAYVDEVMRVEPVDPAWEQLGEHEES